MDTIRELNNMQDTVFNIDCDLDKVRAVLTCLADNTWLTDATITQSQALFLVSSHGLNSDLYLIATDYLFDMANKLNELRDELSKYKEYMKAREEHENNNDNKPEGRSC